MFTIFSENSKSSVCFYNDADEYSGVKKIAAKVRLDIQRVTDSLPQEASALENLGSTAVIYGTFGKSSIITKLIDSGKIDGSLLKNKNEIYSFSIIENPFNDCPSLKNALVIAGSDKRGTIYGLFHLSKLIGVSPLVDWADVLPAKQNQITLTEKDNYISKEPSVRFRGFFINDEWPAYGNWTNKRFGGFNAEMYEHVFELLLRMNGNYFWPAMWSSCFSNDGPDLKNAELADELGVIMGASHHEPCCRAGEEYRHLRGKDSIYGDAWNFRTNKEGITKFWEDGLIRNGKFENVITVGMRGEADTAIMQNATLKDNIDLLRDVIKTQNNLIKKYVNPDVQKVPRMLALYKEVEPYFYGDKHTKGLMNDSELDGVTLMLCDDNHGNLRTVPTEKMRNHKGGYGMYYHFDYHGWPFSYEWINSTALPKIKEQMCAAYEFGIRDLWIVNMGDIMTNEFPLNYFLDLAYDYEKYSAPDYTTDRWTKEWTDFNFSSLSDTDKADVKYIIDNYTQLSHLRRPECLQSDTYHPVNFGESDYILSKAESVIAKAENLHKKENSNTGLFAQVIYPALGTMNVLRMQLYSGKNKWFAEHGCLAANEYASIVQKCYNYDKDLIEEYDKIADGKFYAQGWSEHFGFQNWCEAANKYPFYMYTQASRKGRLVAWVEGNDKTTTGQDWTDRNFYIDAFKNPLTNEAAVYIAQCGQNLVDYTLSFENKNPFLTANITSKVYGYGKTEEDPSFQKITLSIDRNILASSPVKTDTLTISSKDGHGANIKVFVKIDAAVPSTEYAKGTFIQTGDYISIPAKAFTRSQKGIDGSEWKILPDYGRAWCAVKPYPVIESYKKGKGAPCLEYSFVPESDEVYAFDFYLNPSNPAYKDNKLQFIAEVNGQKILKDCVDPKDFAVGDNRQPWGQDVTNNLRISTVYASCKMGLNTLKVYPVTPNIVLEKIVIHNVNKKMPQSYLGAPESFRI